MTKLPAGWVAATATAFWRAISCAARSAQMPGGQDGVLRGLDDGEADPGSGEQLAPAWAR